MHPSRPAFLRSRVRGIDFFCVQGRVFNGGAFLETEGDLTGAALRPTS